MWTYLRAVRRSFQHDKPEPVRKIIFGRAQSRLWGYNARSITQGYSPDGSLPPEFFRRFELSLLFLEPIFRRSVSPDNSNLASNYSDGIPRLFKGILFLMRLAVDRAPLRRYYYPRVVDLWGQYGE